MYCAWPPRSLEIGGRAVKMMVLSMALRKPARQRPRKTSQNRSPLRLLGASAAVTPWDASEDAVSAAATAVGFSCSLAIGDNNGMGGQTTETAQGCQAPQKGAVEWIKEKCSKEV